MSSFGHVSDLLGSPMRWSVTGADGQKLCRKAVVSVEKAVENYSLISSVGPGRVEYESIVSERVG